MKAINVLLALVVSLVIGALVFEVGLRLIGKGPSRTMLEFDADLSKRLWRASADLTGADLT